MDANNHQQAQPGAPYYGMTQGGPEGSQTQEPLDAKVEQQQQDIPQPQWPMVNQPTYNPYAFGVPPHLPSQPHPEPQQGAGAPPHPYAPYGNQPYPQYFGPPMGFGGYPHGFAPQPPQQQQHDARAHSQPAQEQFQNTPLPAFEASHPQFHPGAPPQFQAGQHQQFQQNVPYPGYPPPQFNAGWNMPPSYYHQPFHFGQIQAAGGGGGGQAGTPDPLPHGLQHSTAPGAAAAHPSHAGNPAAAQHAQATASSPVQPKYPTPPAATSPAVGSGAAQSPLYSHLMQDAPLQQPQRVPLAPAHEPSTTTPNASGAAAASVRTKGKNKGKNKNTKTAAATRPRRAARSRSLATNQDDDDNNSDANSSEQPRAHTHAYGPATAANANEVTLKSILPPPSTTATTTVPTTWPLIANRQQQQQQQHIAGTFTAPPAPYGPDATEARYRCTAETERVHKAALEKSRDNGMQETAAAINVHDVKHPQMCAECKTKKKKNCDRRWPCGNCCRLNRPWGDCRYAHSGGLLASESEDEGKGDEGRSRSRTGGSMAAGGQDDGQAAPHAGDVEMRDPSATPGGDDGLDDLFGSSGGQQQHADGNNDMADVSRTAGTQAPASQATGGGVASLDPALSLAAAGSAATYPDSSALGNNIDQGNNQQEQQSERYLSPQDDRTFGPDGPITLGQLAAEEGLQAATSPPLLSQYVDELSRFSK
ncbi:hypothetical protein SLS54_008650 [Diplodia seriata]